MATAVDIINAASRYLTEIIALALSRLPAACDLQGLPSYRPQKKKGGFAVKVFLLPKPNDPDGLTAAGNLQHK